MKIATSLKLGVAALVMSGGMAFAAVNTEALVSDLQSQGYTFIEVKRGPTQIKVEAVRGTEKVETVYDIATGRVLDQEAEAADADERGRTGVQVRDRSRDFVRVSDNGAVYDDSDDRYDDDSRDDDDRDSDDDRGHGNDDDRNDDDNPGRGDDRGRGHDDDGSDDKGRDDDGDDD